MGLMNESASCFFLSSLVERSGLISHGTLGLLTHGLFVLEVNFSASVLVAT